jgi:uncharacterized protein YndB with AHSA1/START domain
VITLAMSTRIGADRRAVWGALTDPVQVPRWRPGHVCALDPLDGYPQPGARMRWRVNLHELPVVLEDVPLDVVPEERLRSAQALGLFRFEETFTLQATGDPEQTRLGIRVSAANEMPLVGGALDRFAVRRFVTDVASSHLQAVRDWCEGHTTKEETLLLPLGPRDAPWRLDPHSRRVSTAR